MSDLNVKKRVRGPFVKLNIKLILIFILCFVVASVTFFVIISYFQDIWSFQEEQKKGEKVEYVLHQTRQVAEKTNLDLSDRNAIMEMLSDIKQQHPTLSLLVADGNGDVKFHTESPRIREKNIKKLIQEKMNFNGQTQRTGDHQYSYFISPVTFNGEMGYLVIDSPPSKWEMNPIKYNRQVYTALGISVIAFLVLFFLLMRPITNYIKQIEQGIGRIVKKDWTYTIPVKGKNELSSLATNINWMTQQLRERFEHERKVEQSKNELITNLSHDLRTPLTSIIGYLQLVKDDRYKSKVELDEYVDTTYRLSQKLKQLLDELFEYTKLSLPDVEMHVQEIDLVGLLHQLVGEYEPIFEMKGYQVQLHLPANSVPLHIDVEKMVRVYDNLLSNAEKYSQGKDIEVKIHETKQEVITSISNITHHISPENVKQLFHRFYRGDEARSSKVAGSGLGLSISKRIVELHKGRIWAESNGDRLTVYVALPRDLSSIKITNDQIHH